MKISDAQKTISFGHINIDESTVINFNFYKKVVGRGLFYNMYMQNKYYFGESKYSVVRPFSVDLH